MIQLIINPNKCKKDGICLDECPMRIITMNADSGLPELVTGAEASCLGCGHCVAVCPHGAVEHSLLPADQSVPIESAKIIHKEQAIQFLRMRRSARKFQLKPVEKQKLSEIIEIARYSPTASNSQLVEWIVFSEKKRITELLQRTVDWMIDLIQQGPQAIYSPYIVPAVEAWELGKDFILRNAPAIVFAIAPLTASYGMVDLTISLSYLELIAPQFGLSTCWAGILHRAMEHHPPLREFVGIGEDYPYFYPMMVGYPKYKYFRLPARKPPKIEWK